MLGSGEGEIKFSRTDGGMVLHLAKVPSDINFVVELE